MSHLTPIHRYEIVEAMTGEDLQSVQDLIAALTRLVDDLDVWVIEIDAFVEAAQMILERSPLPLLPGRNRLNLERIDCLLTAASRAARRARSRSNKRLAHLAQARRALGV